MKGLTDKQRRQILREQYPHIPLSAEEAKSLSPHRIEIKARVHVEVLGAKRDKKTGWYMDYKVVDFRPNFMARSPSGPPYTHSVQLAVAEEAEDAVPAHFQAHLTRRAKEQWDVLHRRKNIKQDLNRLTRQIRDTALEAERRGFDATLHIKALEAELDKLKQELDKEAA